MLTLNLQIALSKIYFIPKKTDFERWLKFVYFPIFLNKRISVNIRLVEKHESIRLNEYFCNKKHFSDVLSFPFEYPIIPQKKSSILLGDIVICPEVLENKIKISKKIFEEYWAHIVIHSALHLVKYDHKSLKDANIMENIEIKLMKKLGYNNPYL
ncbi:MAG: endoribonuclease YbeY [Candidatus Westeberhardia cardiocondylae]|nr:endoribonuclease YbeY [Candidatus Westeberhardia cardiocondylae]